MKINTILFFIALILFAATTCRSFRRRSEVDEESSNTYETTSEPARKSTKSLDKAEKRVNKILDQYSDAIEGLSTDLFNNFAKIAKRNMTVADFSEVILNLNNQGNNALTVEDAERIFDAYDTNDDSALELEEFIPAFREIYLRVYNNQRRIRESSF